MLITLLIVAAVSSTIATALVLFGVGATRSAEALARSVEARGLANACAELALLAVWDDPATAGTTSVALGNGTCEYAVTDTGGSTRLIEATGTSGEAVRNVEVTVTGLSGAITVGSWQEVP